MGDWHPADWTFTELLDHLDEEHWDPEPPVSLDDEHDEDAYWRLMETGMAGGASVVPESRPGTGAAPAGEVGRERTSESPGMTRLSGRSPSLRPAWAALLAEAEAFAAEGHGRGPKALRILREDG